MIRYQPAATPAALAAAGPSGVETLTVLRHVAYEKLEIALDGDTEGLRVRFDLAGSNPEYQAGRPIEFQLNFSSDYGELVKALRLTQHFRSRQREATQRGRPPMVPPS